MPSNNGSDRKRRPPWFMEYGADMIADEKMRLRSAAERGVIASMRWHCWANDSIPNDAGAIARLVGLDREEVEAALPAVLEFFQMDPTDGTRLIDVALTQQMRRFMEIRRKQSEGGLEGAEERWGAQTKRKKKANGSTHT